MSLKNCIFEHIHSFFYQFLLFFFLFCYPLLCDLFMNVFYICTYLNVYLHYFNRNDNYRRYLCIFEFNFTDNLINIFNLKKKVFFLIVYFDFLFSFVYKTRSTLTPSKFQLLTEIVNRINKD